MHAHCVRPFSATRHCGVNWAIAVLPPLHGSSSTAHLVAITGSFGTDMLS